MKKYSEGILEWKLGCSVNDIGHTNTHIPRTRGHPRRYGLHASHTHSVHINILYTWCMCTFIPVSSKQYGGNVVRHDDIWVVHDKGSTCTSLKGLDKMLFHVWMMVYELF